MYDPITVPSSEKLKALLLGEQIVIIIVMQYYTSCMICLLGTEKLDSKLCGSK